MKTMTLLVPATMLGLPDAARAVLMRRGADKLVLVHAHPGCIDGGWLIPPKCGCPAGQTDFVISHEGTGTDALIVKISPELQARLGECNVQASVYDDCLGKGARRKELVQHETSPWRRKRVGLVGCGSLGSSFLVQMVRNGVTNVAALDPDTVESHNTTKSLAYFEHHVGMPKVEALADTVRMIEPGLQFCGYAARFSLDWAKEHGAAFLTGMEVLYFSADNVPAVRELVMWLDERASSGESVPFVLLQLVFQNARAAITLFWDPSQKDKPCPACFLAANPDIHDRSQEEGEVDLATYSPARVTNSSPQICSDIAHHTALAAGIAVGLLSSSAERLVVLGQKPWLYSFSLRGRAEHLDWTSDENAGSCFLWPTYPGRPFDGCSCCQKAGRVEATSPAMPERTSTARTAADAGEQMAALRGRIAGRVAMGERREV